LLGGRIFSNFPATLAGKVRNNLATVHNTAVVGILILCCSGVIFFLLTAITHCKIADLHLLKQYRLLKKMKSEICTVKCYKKADEHPPMRLVQ
jgi:hypothetical protein